MRSKILLSGIGALLLAATGTVLLTGQRLARLAERLHADAAHEKLDVLVFQLLQSERDAEQRGLQGPRPDGRDEVLEALAATTAGGTGKLIVLDAAGKLILPAEADAGPELRRRAEVVVELTAGEARGSVSLCTAGDARWCYWTRYQPNGWNLALLVPHANVYAAVHRFRFEFGLLLFAAVMVSAGILVLAVSHATRPIRRLTTAASEMASGRLEQDIDTSRNDEVGVLARALADMRDSIRRHIHELVQEIRVRHETETELARLNTGLEDAVGERTRELDEARVAAEAASTAKSWFLANMSHEIRTPMTAILGYVELLSEELGQQLSEEERSEGLRTIRSNAEHLLHLVNEILDLSKIESGNMTVERFPVRIREDLETVRDLLMVQAQEKGLSLELRCADDLPATIETDPLRLRQCVVNLAGNAIKFTERGGVVVSVAYEREPERRLRIEVRDSGIGISPAQLERLFEPFTQADESTTRRFGGTGLGLALSKRIAALLGGDLEVRSTVGKGSTFTLTVDPGRVREADAAPRPAAPARGGRGPLPRLRGRVLLAEDGAYNQRLIRMFLSRFGLEADIVPDGAQARELALAARDEDRTYDLILMDMQMPVLDGYSATQELRDRGYAAPIVALTANAMVGDREKCLAAGCDDFATKPIDLRRFGEILARYLPPAPPAG
ncbi:MAG: ATP-binding protein [Planctomycetota bacterium]